MVLYANYAVFGTVLSFLATHVLPSFLGGRSISAIPTFNVHDYALYALAVSVFVIYYACADVGGVGTGKNKFKGEVYETNPTELPKETIYAMRAQLNQAEQFPFFFASSLLFSVVVSARLAGALSVAWVALRIAYSTAYRARANDKDKRLGVFTVPCYILMCTMASTSCVHLLRIVLFG